LKSRTHGEAQFRRGEATGQCDVAPSKRIRSHHFAWICQVEQAATRRELTQGCHDRKDDAANDAVAEEEAKGSAVCKRCSTADEDCVRKLSQK
jgi:hypothetical protein